MPDRIVYHFTYRITCAKIHLHRSIVDENPMDEGI